MIIPDLLMSTITLVEGVMVWSDWLISLWRWEKLLRDLVMLLASPLSTAWGQETVWCLSMRPLIKVSKRAALPPFWPMRREVYMSIVPVDLFHVKLMWVFKSHYDNVPTFASLWVSDTSATICQSKMALLQLSNIYLNPQPLLMLSFLIQFVECISQSTN